MPNDFLFAADDPRDPEGDGREPDAPESHGHAAPAPWLVLVADDEPEVLAVTRLALSRLCFRGRMVRVLGCGSAAEAKRILHEVPDIAVILLDVVMETNDAGLRLVRIIREEMGNSAVRIILRTGQPGEVPEEDVVLSCDIDDYKTKTELTARKLLTCVVAALRSHAAIRALENGRRGLERVLHAADRLFAPRDSATFAAELLAQMPDVLDATPHAVLCRGAEVVAASGRYAAGTAPPAPTLAAARQRGGCVAGTEGDGTHGHRERHGIALPIRSPDGEEMSAWIETGRRPDAADLGLAELYASKIGTAYATLRLTERLREAAETLEARIAERTRALEEANARLNRLATLDPLTGIWNRRRFLELAAAELTRAKRYGRHLGLFLLDLDGFKAINDTHGHAAGDAVLRTVVKRTRAALRSSDHIARFGGEEFVVLLPETDGDGTAVVAERVRAALADSPVMVGETAIAVTGSLGIAAWRPEEPTIDDTLGRADRALYTAKQAGRNRVVQDTGWAGPPYGSPLQS
ncbi:diguanylate cyclase [Azospirillum picis]|uniref:diguanylate cyclase n=1 Tax=Azospirillum picis TaxID=488438 RepID=A0ABU0MPP9_9PROT|nr:diguanylate cyclase [Azospirillum picis]MBP2301731.1 diguanylate cyclase (GGDEF)-like protein [Azospirillum picis]MDQ0535445.1 diguanylate cyclase (GGDEF)-like protein [Azospirillum picis]